MISGFVIPRFKIPLTGARDHQNHRGAQVLTGKRPLRGIAYITGSLILICVAVGLLFYRDLAVAYHVARLGNDPRYMLRLAAAGDGSIGAAALSAYLETSEGRERLRATLVLQMLAHLTEPGIESTTAALDPAAWAQVEVEVRRLHYQGPSQEWWVLYSAQDDAGRKTAGSTRANDTLVALERHLTLVETGGAGATSLPDYPGMEFEWRPSEAEKGEWRVVSRRK